MLLWKTSFPTSVLRQGHPEQVVQDVIQADFEDLQEERLHNLSGQPVQVLGHLHSLKKNNSLMFRRSLLCFILCLLPLVLSLHTTEMSLAVFFLHCHFKDLYTLVRSPLTLLFCRLNSHSFLSFSSQKRCSSPSISLALNLTLFSTSVWPALAPTLQVQVHQCWAERKGDLPPPAGNHLLQRQAVSCSTGYPTGTSGPLLPSWSPAGCLGLFLTRCRSLHFSLLNFLRFLLSAHFSSCQGPSRWQHDLWHVNCSSQF